MTRLMIVGNGFDLFHNIKSSYQDFRKYISENSNDEFLENIEKYIDGDELWSNFEYALSIVDITSLEDDNSHFYLSYDDEEWSESANFDYQMMIEEGLSFYKDIEPHLKKWVSELDLGKKRMLKKKQVKKFDKFLNFNYTPLLQQLYKIDDSLVCHIHGTTESEKMIIGHGDESKIRNKTRLDFDSEEEFEDYCEYINERDFRDQEADSVIKEYFRSTYKPVSELIKQNQSFFRELGKLSEVFIIGHSLAAVDLPYFKEIFMYTHPKTEWKVTYYSSNDKDRFKNTIKTLGVKGKQIEMINIKSL